MKSFARGTPGLGLIILRVTVAINIFALICRYSVTGAGEIVSFVLAIVGLLLLFGLFTRVSSCIGGIVAVLSMIALGDATVIPLCTAGLLCVALALAGPGAYS